jgi:hypothetical protein
MNERSISKKPSPQSKPAKTPRQKMRDYRARMRAKGLRPIQIWVPDVRAPGFAEECARQWKLVTQSPDHEGIMKFLEAVSDWEDLPEYDWGPEGPPTDKEKD